MKLSVSALALLVAGEIIPSTMAKFSLRGVNNNDNNNVVIAETTGGDGVVNPFANPDPSKEIPAQNNNNKSNNAPFTMASSSSSTITNHEEIEYRKKHYYSSEVQNGKWTGDYLLWKEFPDEPDLAAACESTCVLFKSCNSYLVMEESKECFLSTSTELYDCTLSTGCEKYNAYTFNTSNSIRVVSNGDIRVGAGSYYTNDEEVTLIQNTVADVDAAWQWVQSFDDTENPVVMFQLIPDQGSFDVWAHRLKFMSQNLDASTGKSPLRFAQDQASWLQTGNGFGGDVYARSDQWYAKNLPINIWGKLEGGLITVGPGSYYVNQPGLTEIVETVHDVQAAWNYIGKYESTNNQVVMWQLGNFGSDPNAVVLMLHFKNFMFQNLDANNGKSPAEFAIAQADYINGQGGGDVYVRTDYWWSSNDVQQVF